MSARMQVPLSQRRHTNIAVVRYTKNGVKLEIACYKNKVISYRSGLETRLDEVLQVDRIFANVGRGFVASEKDILTVFGEGVTEQQAIKYMLEHGELQVAQQERTAEVDEMFNDIAVIISQKCVNVKTQRPFPSLVIEQALRSIGAGVKLDQPVKKQALGLIHQLIDSEVIPIARADMKLRCVTRGDSALELVQQWCDDNDATILEKKVCDEGKGGAPPQVSVLLTIQPNLFRELDQLVKSELPAGSTLHMVEAVVMEIGEGDVSDLAVAKANQHNHGTPASMGIVTSSVGTDSADAPPDAAARQKASRGKGNNNNNNKTSSSCGDNKSLTQDAGGAPQKQNKKKGNRKGRRGQDSDDDEDDVAPRGGLAGAGNDLTAQLQRLGLGPNDGDDSDDDEARGGGGKGKRGKKNKKKGGNAVPAPAAKGNTQQQQEVDSDEELEGNRRQRKKGGAEKQHYNNNNEEDDYDYDYDE